MATVNIATNTWQTQRETSTISITAKSTSVKFDMGYELTDEMAWAKACVAIDASKYKSITFQYSGKTQDGLSSLEFGVYDNMTPDNSSGKIGIATDAWDSSGSGSITVNISSLTGTKYVGFRFYGNTYTLNDNVGWSVLQKLNITSLTAVESGYTLTYNANGGSGAPSAVSNITSTTISSTKPTRTGYNFLGWSKSSSATSASYTAGDSISLSANTTLYAVWEKKTYTVAYNANGGSGAPSNQTKTYGVDLTLSSTEPTMTGYTFLGWATSSSATSATYQPGATYTSNASVTLYAVWQIKTYTVTYNANGGSGAPSSQTKTYGETLTLSSTKPSKSAVSAGNYTVTLNANGGACSSSSLTAKRTTSYTFSKWNTESDGTGTSYDSGASYTKNATLKLYAIYTSSTSTETVALPTAVRDGYEFVGWATSSTATSGNTGSYIPTENVTLYAIWKPMGLVYIYDNSGAFNTYKIMIYDVSGWNQYIPYIYTESGWVEYSG